jgi:hypothetical protein
MRARFAFEIRVGADQRRDLAPPAVDALDALGLRAELLVEDDLLELGSRCLPASSSGRSRRRSGRRTGARG